MIRIFRIVRSFYELRPYQRQCIDTSLDKYHAGILRQAVSLPVGAGKTVILASLIRELPPTPHRNRVLVLAHREELLVQAKKKIEAINPTLNVGIERGEESALETDDVIVASVPTLGRSKASTECKDGNVNQRLSRLNHENFKCIIIDEAHHAVADTYIRILNHFRVFEANNRILLWGCSATLNRLDCKALGDVFQEISFHLELSSMFEQGWLAVPEVFTVHTDVNLSKVTHKEQEGDHDQSMDSRPKSLTAVDFVTRELELAINTPIRNKLIAKTWFNEAQTTRKRKATVVFALNVAHVEGLIKAFREIGVSCEAITGSTPTNLRRDILQRFSVGEISVLVNCAVLTEGTDLPITDCIVMTRPTCNPNMYMQMIGRGLRKHPGKDYCLVLDIIDKNLTQTRTLVTMPSLLARVSGSSEVTEANTEQQVNVITRENPREIEIEGVEIRTTPLGEALFDVDLRNQPYSWVKIDRYSWVLQLATKDFIEIHIMYGLNPVTCSLYRHRDGTRISLIEECLLPGALKYAEAYIGALPNAKEINYNTKTDAYWRHSAISHSQFGFLTKIISGIPEARSNMSDIFSWTKAQAADVLNRYSFITQIRHQKIENWNQLLPIPSSTRRWKKVQRKPRVEPSDLLIENILKSS